MPAAGQSLADAIAMAQAGQLADAVGLIERLADTGDADALFALADAHWRGVGVPQDLGRGRELFARAADVGQPMAIRATTNLLSSGIAGPRGWSAAVDRLRAEAGTDPLRARMLELIAAMDLDSQGDPAAIPPGETLSTSPEITLHRAAFSAAECEFLRLLAEPTYEPSIVTVEGKTLRDPVRTSDGSTIHWLIEDPATHALNRRLAALTGTSVDRGEPLQILRYRPGQQYHPHHDWLDEDNRRVMTALAYLNDDYSGGETAFVRTGLSVRGRKGDVLTFKSMAADGSLDPLSEHAGLPVQSGVKYLASRWIRERRHTPSEG